MVRVKICGITNVRDAWSAVRCGADALGFIFAPSPRRVIPEKARNIIDTLPPFINTVGVFADEEPDTILHIMDFCRLNFVQLHGDEPPAFCRQLILPVMKAFQMKDESSLLPIQSYQGYIKAVVLDTHHNTAKGGTGKSFDWRLAIKAKRLGIPIILSGGLSPSNIQKAILMVRPYAVDINSGIEESPGKKDADLMRQVMKQIDQIDRRGKEYNSVT